MVGLLVDGQWRTHHQWRHRVLSYARDLVHECNILFQNQQLHIAEGFCRSYNDSGFTSLLIPNVLKLFYERRLNRVFLSSQGF